MGASGWSHFAPYEPDISRALERLRASVFQSGTFYATRAAKKSKTIDELMKKCRESGTHSALDVHRVVPDPFPLPVLAWHSEFLAKTGAPPSPEQFRERMLDEAKRIGSVAPLSDEKLIEFFGTKQPQHGAVEIKSFSLSPLIPRGCALYIVVYDTKGAPCELFFVGKTGD